MSSWIRFHSSDGSVGFGVLEDDCVAEYEGRWYIAPSNVRIAGGGWSQERVPVDGFELDSDDAGASVLRNDRFELTVFRRPVARPRPAIALTATWDGHEEAVVLAEVREL